MTVIAWDGEFMVADRKVSMPSHSFASTKIFIVPDGIVGCAGDNNRCEELTEWFMNGRPADKFPAGKGSGPAADKAKALFVSNDYEIFLYLDSSRPTKVDQTYMAIGSGAAPAMVAMHLEHSAIVAVKAVNTIVNTCGMGYDVYQRWSCEGSGGFTLRPEMGRRA